VNAVCNLDQPSWRFM